MPSTGPAEFFHKTAELKLFEYLLERQEKAVLVCDKRCYDYLKTRLREEELELRAGLILWAGIKESPAEALQQYSNVFVCSLDSEAKLVAHLRHTFPERQIFGLVNDVATCLAANSNPWKPGNSAPNLDDEIQALDKLILIFSTARSGSTYVCDLMHSGGLCGETKEDLRPHIIYLARLGSTINFDIEKWLAILIRANKRQGVFASKVIAHFLFDLLGRLDEATKTTLVSKLSRVDTRLIYLYRSEKVKQAVSSYFANQVQVWHVASESAQNELNSRASQVAYNFEKLEHALGFILSNELKLAELIESAGMEYSRIVYEDVVEQPAEQMRKVAAGIGSLDDYDAAQIGSRLQRTSNKKTAQIEAQFRSDLEKTQSQYLIEAQQ